MSIFDRSISLIGESNVEQLRNKKVIVIGLGGVGGYVVEMLSRSGIGNLTLVDFDTVSESNINRQIIATKQNIGKYKTDCFKERIASINEDCKVQCICEKLLPENLDKFCFNQYDFIVDCIDLVTSKIALIEYCNKNNLKIISSMGAGNRFEMPNFEICDISKTKNDGLAKVIRNKLRKDGILHTLVAYTSQDAKKQKPVGSIAYFPAMCGITIGAYVLNYFIKKENILWN